MVKHKRPHPSPQWLALCLLGFLVLDVDGNGRGVLAADVSPPSSDSGKLGRGTDSRKASAPVRTPPNSVQAPTPRSQWKSPVPQPQRNTGLHDGVSAQVTKPVAPNPVPTDIPTTQAASATGPVIVGRVIYRGAVPPPTQEQVTRDVEVCGPTVNIAPLSVDSASRGVRDAIVHVGVGEEVVEDVPVQVSVVKNHRCAFYPRIAALRAGVQTEITNDDPVMHNTNMTLNTRMVLNVALVAGGNPIRKPLKKQGLHLLKCNVHKFMQAYRYVFADPYFDQTNEAGQFRIVGLPPGLQAISVWHETLGVLHKEVQVPARGAVTVDFEYN